MLAASETAFTRMNRIRALSLEDEGRKHAQRLAVMLERPERTLNVLLLLILVCQMTSASLLGILLEGAFGGAGLVIGLVLQIIVYFVIGEVAPKTYSIQHPDRAALFLTPFLWAISTFPPLRLLSRAFIGLANVMLPGKGLKEGPFVTEEDLRTMADVAADEEAIEREERQLIHSIFEFGDTVVREVMVPRPDMVAIDAEASIEDAISRAIEAGYSRMPCYEDTTDDIVGLVYLKDLVQQARAGAGRRPVRIAVRDAVFVPEQKRVAELLREMRTEKFHMAIVIDEHGGTAGIVTLEDLLEEIVGEITDEFDVEGPGIEPLVGGGWRAPGRTPDRRRERRARTRVARHRVGHRGWSRVQPARARAGGGGVGPVPGTRLPDRARRRPPHHVGRHHPGRRADRGDRRRRRSDQRDRVSDAAGMA